MVYHHFEKEKKKNRRWVWVHQQSEHINTQPRSLCERIFNHAKGVDMIIPLLYLIMSDKTFDKKKLKPTLVALQMKITLLVGT